VEIVARLSDARYDNKVHLHPVENRLAGMPAVYCWNRRPDER
jgi:hypothetical protein